MASVSNKKFNQYGEQSYIRVNLCIKVKVYKSET